MSIQGTYQNGTVLLDAPTDWPNGLHVHVVPIVEAMENDIVGMTEAEQGDDPDAINKWIEKFSAIPALVWSEAEHDRLEEWKRRMKAFNIEAVRREFESPIQ